MSMTKTIIISSIISSIIRNWLLLKQICNNLLNEQFDQIQT